MACENKVWLFFYAIKTCKSKNKTKVREGTKEKRNLIKNKKVRKIKMRGEIERNVKK